MKMSEMRKLAKQRGLVVPFGSTKATLERWLKDDGFDIEGDDSGLSEPPAVPAPTGSSPQEQKWKKEGENADATMKREFGDDWRERMGLKQVPVPGTVRVHASNHPDGAFSAVVDDKGTVGLVIPTDLIPVTIGTVAPSLTFADLFNKLMVPGRGYTLDELTDMAGFKVENSHFDEAEAAFKARLKNGGTKWVRIPKNQGENRL
jgi:hypothetical protein